MDTPEHSYLNGPDHEVLSRLTTTECSLNPLIAMLMPLFTSTLQLLQFGHGLAIQQIQDDMLHELKAFEASARRHRFTSQVVLAARYLICAWIDDLIIHSGLKVQTQWAATPLLSRLQQHADGPEKFYVILERCLEEPEKHLELLELIHLCLRLGYVGPMREKEQGQARLADSTSRLYAAIRHFRQNSQTLSLPPVKKPQRTYWAFWLLGSLCVLITALLLYRHMDAKVSHSIQPAMSLISQNTAHKVTP